MSDKEPVQLEIGIPKCRRKCSECAESKHHWIEAALDTQVDPEAEPSHRHEVEIIADWKRWTAEDPHGAPVTPMVWTCKHCDFWMRYLAACDVCEGPADEACRCLSWKQHHSEIADDEEGE